MPLARLELTISVYQSDTHSITTLDLKDPVPSRYPSYPAHRVQFISNCRVNIHNTKINNFGSERLIWRFEQFHNKLLLLESVVLARRRNAVDAMPLVTALYPISVAQAQSTFLTASEKAPSNRLLLSCFALKRFQRPILPSAPRLTCTLGGHSNLGSYRVI